VARRNEIEFLIKVREQASAALKDVAEAVGDVSKQAGDSLADLRRMDEQLDNVGDSSESAVGSLKKFAGVLAGVLTVREVVEYADSWRLAENKIRIVTNSTKELATVQKELVGLATRTRSDFEGVVDLFTRVARSSDTLGLSQERLIGFTETVSQAIRVSGATTMEASAGIIQFAQGLAAGALRGDELRSVMEQLPRLAIAIADGMGKTVGELRNLGTEGKLTAELVIDALEQSAPEIAAEFASMQATVGESFEVMQTNLRAFIGTVDSTTGTTVFLADSIITISGLIDQFGKVLSGTLQPQDEVTAGMKLFATAALVAIDVVGVLTAAIKDSLTIAFKSLGGVVGGVAAGLVQFAKGNLDESANIMRQVRSDFNETLTEGFRGFEDEAIANTSMTIEKIVELWSKGARDIAEVTDLSKSGESSFINPELLTRLSSFIGTFETAEQEVKRKLADLRSAIAIGLVPDKDEQERIRQDILNILTEGIDEITVKTKKRFSKPVKESFDFVKEAAISAVRSIQSAFADFYMNIGSGTRQMAADFINAIRRMIAEILAFQTVTTLFGKIPGFDKILPGRAAGGPVTAGVPFLVGERGPELFIPNNSGSIAPNGAGLSQGFVFSPVTKIDARGADPGLIARLPKFIDQRDKILMLKVKRYFETGVMPI
jgi:tape measure domain-containing protein